MKLLLYLGIVYEEAIHNLQANHLITFYFYAVIINFSCSSSRHPPLLLIASHVQNDFCSPCFCILPQVTCVRIRHLRWRSWLHGCVSKSNLFNRCLILFQFALLRNDMFFLPLLKVYGWRNRMLCLFPLTVGLK